MKTDLQIQRDVMDELKWEPFLDSAEIGVAVKNGIVTLSGIVDSYMKKLTAEKTAKKIAGVKAVAEDIQVGISPNYRKTDAEIAEAVINSLKWHSAIKDEKVKIKVEDGNVRLEGEVDWAYQKNNIQAMVQGLTGVRSVTNLITIKPLVTPSDIQQKIRAAFQRNAGIDAGKITVTTLGSTVTLKGKVRSHTEKDDAESVAWAAPGVNSVENYLEVETPEYAYDL
jgi:osmotically-inducible protein OsmY